MIPRVALIGANGHGQWHRRQLAAAQGEGRLTLVALADVQPVEGAEAPVFTDHRELLADTRPDAVVICTPPHTHLPIALDALAAGCDVMLEKPPVRTLGEHEVLLAAVAASGRACQVGFQALGSTATARLLDATRAMGRVSGIAAVASWRRTDAYYRRAQWAGRRTVAGRPVVDGVLVNPLAHALMEGLVVARAAGAGEPVELEVERYRTRPIEVDDTAFARITFGGGLRMTIAATLAGEDFIAGEVIVTGPAGRAVLEYPTDRLALPGEAELSDVPGRVDLLSNLLAHRNGTPPPDQQAATPPPAHPDGNPLPARHHETPSPGQQPGTPPPNRQADNPLPARHHDTLPSGQQPGTAPPDPRGSVPLLSPLAGTAGFTAVLEALTGPEMPLPVLLGDGVVTSLGEGPERIQVIVGINAVLRRVADTGLLPSELGIAWSEAPVRSQLGHS